MSGLSESEVEYVQGRKTLEGSRTADAFKRWHKDGPSWAYACDLDLLFLGSNGELLAVVDHKDPRKTDLCLGWAHIKTYNAFDRLGIPVYLVVCDPDFSRFTVFRYAHTAQHRKDVSPNFQHTLVMHDGTPEDYWRWESQVRGRRVDPSTAQRAVESLF